MGTVYTTSHSHFIKRKKSIRYTVAYLYLFFLYVSPLLYLTGSAEFVTPLVVSNFINIPSLSGINYIVMIVAIIASINIKRTKVLLMFICMVFLFLFISFRNVNEINFFYSLISQLIIISPAFIFVFSRKQLSFIDEAFVRKILIVYISYCVLSIIIHYFILAYAKSAGIHFPNERMVGIFKNPNHMAAFAILTLILSYYLSIHFHRTTFSMGVFVEVLSTVCVYLSGSRSALLLLIMIVIYKRLFLSKSRVFLFFSIIFASVFSLYVVYHTLSISELIAIFSKRDASELENAGNMRISILIDMLREFSAISLVSGDGSGEGTAVFIKLQSMLGYKVTWLDSNVNAIIYTYGLIFFTFLYFAMIAVTVHSIYTKEVKAMMYLYICWFFWFFNISEYFPIIFIAFLVTAKAATEQNQSPSPTVV